MVRPHLVARPDLLPPGASALILPEREAEPMAQERVGNVAGLPPEACPLASRSSTRSPPPRDRPGAPGAAHRAPRAAPSIRVPPHRGAMVQTGRGVAGPGAGTPFREMTGRWPECPPCEGRHPDPLPHLIPGDHGTRGRRMAGAWAVERRLPSDAVARHAWPMTGARRPGGWSVPAQFELDPATRPIFKK